MLFSNFRIEGEDYFQEEQYVPAFYFRVLQPMDRHTRTPLNRHIYVYSFALHPEKHQPSGTYNFSKIDHRYIRFLLNPVNFTNSEKNEYKITIFARNYNLLTISNGMGMVEYAA